MTTHSTLLVNILQLPIFIARNLNNIYCPLFAWVQIITSTQSVFVFFWFCSAVAFYLTRLGLLATDITLLCLIVAFVSHGFKIENWFKINCTQHTAGDTQLVETVSGSCQKTEWTIRHFGLFTYKLDSDLSHSYSSGWVKDVVNI